MNREDIIRMANEAGIIHPQMVDKTLERFAALVASAERESLRESFRVVTAAEASAAILHEREACANAMAYLVMTPTLTHGALVKLSDVVNAIRARGNVATNDTSQERVDKTSEIVHEAQRTWVGLTEKDILEAAVKSQEGISPRNDTLRFAVAIEAKLKEKNCG